MEIDSLNCDTSLLQRAWYFLHFLAGSLLDLAFLKSRSLLHTDCVKDLIASLGKFIQFGSGAVDMNF